MAAESAPSIQPIILDSGYGEPRSGPGDRDGAPHERSSSMNVPHVITMSYDAPIQPHGFSGPTNPEGNSYEAANSQMGGGGITPATSMAKAAMEGWQYMQSTSGQYGAADSENKVGQGYFSGDIQEEEERKEREMAASLAHFKSVVNSGNNSAGLESQRHAIGDQDASINYVEATQSGEQTVIGHTRSVGNSQSASNSQEGRSEFSPNSFQANEGQQHSFGRW